MCDYEVGKSFGMAWAEHCPALELWIPLWYGDTQPVPSFPQTPVQRSEVILLGVIPAVTQPGWGMGRPASDSGWGHSSNASTNQILIEFRRTCKNSVPFCYSVFLTDVPVIPVKWSAVVDVVCSDKHARTCKFGKCSWDESKPCACPWEGWMPERAMARLWRIWNYEVTVQRYNERLCKVWTTTKWNREYHHGMEVKYTLYRLCGWTLQRVNKVWTSGMLKEMVNKLDDNSSSYFYNISHLCCIFKLFMLLSIFVLALLHRTSSENNNMQDV